jgi:hypothetical protein
VSADADTVADADVNTDAGTGTDRDTDAGTDTGTDTDRPPRTTINHHNFFGDALGPADGRLSATHTKTNAENKNLHRFISTQGVVGDVVKNKSLCPSYQFHTKTVGLINL